MELEIAHIPVGTYEGLVELLRQEERPYWTVQKIRDLSESMAAAIRDALPSGGVPIDADQWKKLTNDLRAQTSISPQQWAAELGRCVVA